MPFKILIHPNSEILEVQYQDASGNAIKAPEGAIIEWTIDDPNILKIEAAESGRAKLTVLNGGVGTISAKIAGINDPITGNTFEEETLQVNAYPAQPARIQYGS